MCDIFFLPGSDTGPIVGRVHRTFVALILILYLAVVMVVLLIKDQERTFKVDVMIPVVSLGPGFLS